MRFLRADEAIKTMSLFEGALVTKKITKSALKNWLVNSSTNKTSFFLKKFIHYITLFLTLLALLGECFQREKSSCTDTQRYENSSEQTSSHD